MNPNWLGWMIIGLFGLVAYFLISTQLIRLEPVGPGETITTDGQTERAETLKSTRSMLKNLESIEREKSNDWQCPKCKEHNGQAFEVCWNCGANRESG